MKNFFPHKIIRNIPILVAAFGILAFSLFISDAKVFAGELTPSITASTDADTAVLTDGRHKTTVFMDGGSTLTVTATDGADIYGVYIIWDDEVTTYTITTADGDINCGLYGFIHDYIALDTPSKQVIINIPEGAGKQISDIRIFNEGELPEDVQVWNPPVEHADIMLVSAHADDEILFLGGIIPTYTYLHDAQIQVVYMTEYWSAAKIREHEKLDGLWRAGLKNYPVCGGFEDFYSKSIDTAMRQYDYDAMVEFLTEQIRKFHPQVIATHDLNGEYGHGFHMLTAKAVTDAVSAAADETMYTDSSSLYGAWDTSKTYLHLYEENCIHLDLHIPIEEADGETALEIASAAYEKHVSQQWCWFYVSDDYEYSCADFGLYRTNVGLDTENNMLEHIKIYSLQLQEIESVIAEELESLDAESDKLNNSLGEIASSLDDLYNDMKDLDSSRRMTYFIIAVIGVFTVGVILLFMVKNKKRRR